MITIIKADFENPHQTRAILEMLNVYSQDAMGQSAPLSDYVQEHLIEGLKSTPNAMVFLAFEDDIPAGIATCFWGFSTFKAKKLINIHDLAVAPEFRGRGVGNQLLEVVQHEATSAGCCKITLEVRDDNRAKNLYKRFGFEPGQPEMLFWTKEF